MMRSYGTTHALLIFLGTILMVNTPAFADTSLTQEARLEKFFLDSIPEILFLSDCHKPTNSEIKRIIKVGKSYASVFCTYKYQGANVKVDLSMAPYYRRSTSNYNSVTVGERKIDYTLVDLLRHKAALRQYRNGSFQTISVEINGDRFRFNIEMTGEKIVTNEQFLSTFTEIKIDNFIKTSKELFKRK